MQNVAYSEEGFDRLSDYSTDGLLERRGVFSHSREPYKIASVGWAHEPGKDRSAHINAKVSIDPWDIDQTSHSDPSSGEVREDVFTQRHVWKTYELSGDVTRRLLGGLIKLNALATRRDRRHDDTSVRLEDAGLLEGIAYELDDMRDERVLRLGWTRATATGWSLEFGGEGAYNRLSSETGLFTIDAQNQRTRVDLPIETAIVSEHRGEIFTNLVRNVSSSFSSTLAPPTRLRDSRSAGIPMPGDRSGSSDQGHRSIGRPVTGRCNWASSGPLRNSISPTSSAWRR